MYYQMHKISVLVVEDNIPMLEITKTLLQTFGVGAVYGAHNGEMGFETFCRVNPDIVIADWMMKPTDGIALARKIRNDPHSPNPYVPLILMTGFSEKRRVFEARDAGVTEFLVKPFNARDLYKRIVQVIERPRQFVRADDFFGPDRRRKSDASYTGPDRREGNASPSAEAITAHIRQQQAAAHIKLQDLRTMTGLEKGDKFDLPENLQIDWVTRKE